MNYKRKSKALLLTIILTLVLSGCSLVSVEKKYYKDQHKEIPREKLQSFESREAIAAGATLNNHLANEAFYRGLEAGSEKAKALLELSYKFLGFLGVNNKNIDPEDPLSLEKVMEDFDKANTEKDKVIQDFREQAVKAQIEAERGKAQLERDKKAEFEANNNKWQAKMGSIFWWIIFFVILGVILLVAGAGVIQYVTGVPLLTGLITGSLRAMGKGFHQVVAGTQNFIDDAKETLRSETATQEEKAAAQTALDKITLMMNNVQDEDVRGLIEKVKKSPRVLKNLFHKRS